MADQKDEENNNVVKSVETERSESIADDQATQSDTTYDYGSAEGSPGSAMPVTPSMDCTESKGTQEKEGIVFVDTLQQDLSVVSSLPEANPAKATGIEDAPVTSPGSNVVEMAESMNESCTESELGPLVMDVESEDAAIEEGVDPSTDVMDTTEPGTEEDEERSTFQSTYLNASQIADRVEQYDLDHDSIFGDRSSQRDDDVRIEEEESDLESLPPGKEDELLMSPKPGASMEGLQPEESAECSESAVSDSESVSSAPSVAGRKRKRPTGKEKRKQKEKAKRVQKNPPHVEPIEVEVKVLKSTWPPRQRPRKVKLRPWNLLQSRLLTSRLLCLGRLRQQFDL